MTNEGKTPLRTVGLISLGCAKNRVDAERILGGLAARGFEIVEDPMTADVVFVNTCGFIRDAVEESVEEILEAARCKTQGRCRVLAVSGCLVKRYPQMRADLPEVDLFFTPDEIASIPDVLAGTPEPVTPRPQPARLLTTPPHSTYLKIAEGCSNLCAYCTIPGIRGPFRSADADALVEEARRLADLGTVELCLIAQDVTSFGADCGDPRALEKLLRRLEDIRGLRWLRLLYAYPRELPPGVEEMLAGGGKLVPYLDVPIQHAHPRILKAMGRKTDEAALRRFFEGLRRRLPGVALRTTAIVGFPGETEEEFLALLTFAQEVRFHHLGAFVYSPEEGTPAARLRKRVDEQTAWERRDRLLEQQAEISAGRNAELVGRTLDVLVEGIDEEGEVVGRIYAQAPEVDGITRLPDYPDEVVEVGGFVRARIAEAQPYDLIAREVALPEDDG